MLGFAVLSVGITEEIFGRFSLPRHVFLISLLLSIDLALGSIPAILLYLLISTISRGSSNRCEHHKMREYLHHYLPILAFLAYILGLAVGRSLWDAPRDPFVVFLASRGIGGLASIPIAYILGASIGEKLLLYRATLIGASMDYRVVVSPPAMLREFLLALVVFSAIFLERSLGRGSEGIASRISLLLASILLGANI